ncbi:hypothetical protein GCK32_021629 [Trichostrongylus colubriformis]|uniref:Uncharacterized protein n=1 Tax=Trichostrongylus colubriformis TaxID=6319 RepID=A0AAN8G4M5_TRICO
MLEYTTMLLSLLFTDTKVSCRPFTVHRTVKTEEPNDIRGATINAIRRKFGAPIQRESAFSPRHAKVSV